MAESMPQLRIIAEPRASYRERYITDTKPSQRFVRADDNPHQLSYPTIEIPNTWLSKRQQPLYIRLILVTVPNERVSVRCVHPYLIHTEDLNVIKDPSTNSLYFPISDEELLNGRKSFRFSQQKMTQYQLINYGPLRLLNSGVKDDRGAEDLTDAKKMIEIYQLRQSQLLFSVAKFRHIDQLPIIFDVSSVFSQVMTGMATPANDDDNSFRCSPRRGDWEGRDEILMVIPKVDKRKAFTVRFEHPLIEQRTSINLEFVDAKTISFYTPPCPVPFTRDNPTVTIPIVVTQGEVEIARLNFVYQSSNRCLSCNPISASTSCIPSTSNKRSHSEFEYDGIKFQDLVLNGTGKRETNLTSIQNYISSIRTSSAVKTEDHFLLLDDAIRQGNSSVAVKLIKQRNDLLERKNDQDETPLLLAARLNHSMIIRLILRKRPELAQQVDKQGNNLLHRLAGVSEDKAQKTIGDVLILLDENISQYLLSMPNNDDQIPQQVAEIHDNKQCIALLEHQIK